MDPKDINFNKFCVYINETCSLQNLALAGVFGVECNKTQRIIILGANYSILLSMEKFFDDVLNGSIKQPELLTDLKKDGK